MNFKQKISIKLLTKMIHDLETKINLADETATAKKQLSFNKGKLCCYDSVTVMMLEDKAILKETIELIKGL